MHTDSPEDLGGVRTCMHMSIITYVWLVREDFVQIGSYILVQVQMILLLTPNTQLFQLHRIRYCNSLAF